MSNQPDNQSATANTNSEQISTRLVHPTPPASETNYLDVLRNILGDAWFNWPDEKINAAEFTIRRLCAPDGAGQKAREALGIRLCKTPLMEVKQCVDYSKQLDQRIAELTLEIERLRKGDK